MNREDIFIYVRKTYGTEADYPWHDENAVLRHRNNKKWISARLDGSVPDEVIKELLAISYELTGTKRKVKKV